MTSTAVTYRSHFEKLVAESVDETFADLLGKSGRQALYSCLEKSYSLSKDQIPCRLNDFSLALDDTFGGCSRAIAMVIAKRLYSKLGLPFAKNPGYALVEYVREAKMRCHIRGGEPLDRTCALETSDLADTTPSQAREYSLVSHALVTGW